MHCRNKPNHKVSEFSEFPKLLHEHFRKVPELSAKYNYFPPVLKNAQLKSRQRQGSEQGKKAQLQKKVVKGKCF